MTQATIDFLRKYDPDYPRKVHGASRHDIERVKSLSGQSLPAAYEDFLSTMGRSMGDLKVPQTNFSIDRVIEFYSQGAQLPPPHYLFIAAHEQDPYIDYYLDLRTSNGSDSEVVRITSEVEEFKSQYVHPLFLSFQDLIFTFAFTLKRMSYLAHRTQLIPSPPKAQKQGLELADTLSTLEALALRMGFQKLLLTSSRCLMLERQDAALYGRATPQGGVHAELAASTESEKNRLREIICDHTALV
ncbi:SMI1/KNR4 family protein [Hyalangium minutum]|uniref:SMI1/KNR4 family protein n=1 Tax=Hyalangium minutum TaxID=394096 RepID=UPI0005C53505|nr:SMI1/KNR4 family protein [Hyalangium minutum]